MRNAKKLLLLLLSLVLLIGVFTIAALAEETTGAQTATVLYPDGTSETVAVDAEILTEKFVTTDDGVKLYYGENNTLFKATENWIFKFSVDGVETTLEGTTVPEEAAGQTITASGFEKVYFTHTTAGVTTYDTSASAYAANLKSLLNYPAVTGSDLRMYADASMTNIVLRGAHGGIKNYLDLNGHKLTITNSASHAIETRAPHFAIYSSQPGAVINASGCTNLLYANDDGSSDKEYDTHYNLTSKCQHAGSLVFGEREAQAAGQVGEHGTNITAYCKTLSVTFYGNGVNIYGGTFIQAGTNDYFIRLMRKNLVVQNANFVLTNPSSGFIAASSNATAVRSFTNCNFIYAGEGAVPLFSDTTVITSGSTDTDAHLKEKAYTFTNCNFYNVLPECTVTYPYEHRYTVKENNTNVIKNTYTGTDIFAASYNNCTFGMSGAFPAADLDASEAGAKYLAHSATTKTVTVSGETYTLDGVLITDPSTQALKLTLDGLRAEYWMKGTKPSFESEAFTTVWNGKICSDPYYDHLVISDKVNSDGEVIATGEATAPLKFKTIGEDAAFTYQVAGEEMQFVASTGSPDEDGVNFHLILNNLSNVTIKMYSDIVLHNGVLFGTTKDYVDKIDKVVQKLDATGNVDWDLNGYKVTVAADVTPLDYCIYGEGTVGQSGAVYINVLHAIGGNKEYTFRLYSSVPGGEYINNSSYEIFGISKYSTDTPTYLLGTNDHTVSGGDNFTLISAAPIVRGYENSSAGPLGANFYINGGTYVYTGKKFAFHTAGVSKIYNAKIITMDAAKTVFLNHHWCTVNFLLADSEVIAKDVATYLVEVGNNGLGTAATSKTQTITISNVSFAGGTLLSGYRNGVYSFTFEGDIKASTPESLAAAYPTALDEKVTAYSSITVNGETAKVLGYCDASAVATVKNIATGLTEDWLVGATYYAGEISKEQKIGDVWYYYENPIWGATVDGEAVTEILDAKNAGKIVVVSIDGDKETLYFTILFADGTFEPYTGDAAAAKLALEKTLVSVGTVGFDLTFYSDMTSTHTTTFTLSGKDGVHYRFNLNGFTWTVNITATETKQHALQFQYGKFIIYSTEENAKMAITGNVKSFLMANNAGAVYLGERSIDETQNGKNITFECDKLCDYALWGKGLYVLGGTFVKASDTPTDFFINLENGRLYGFDRATFILNNVQSFFKTGWFSDTNAITENVSILSATKMNLFISGAVVEHKNYTFSKCNFYNVVVNNSGNESLNLTFTDCNFNLSSLEAQTVGYIAYTGAPEPETITINGVDYVFTAKLLAADQVGLVNWGFGMNEYWQVGATATHDNVVIDGIFNYEFKPIDAVVAGDNTGLKRLAGVKNGAIGMSLTLQSQIGVNLIVNAANKEGVSFKTEGTGVKVVTDEETGNLIATYAVAPTVAKDNVEFIIVIGTNVHKVSVNIENYARVILKSTAHSAAHKLTYAMIEYVRAMTGDDEFCNVTEPVEGYIKQTLAADDGKNNGQLLTGIRFNLVGTIEIEIAGEAAEGKAVNLVLATGRSEWGTIVDGSVVFTGLYVNEFFGEMTLKVYDVTGEGEDAVKKFIEGEEYTYSLANYLHGIIENGATDNEQAGVQALYNYAHHANEYVTAMRKTENGNAENA